MTKPPSSPVVKVDLILLAGAPRAVIVLEHGNPVELVGPVSVAILWLLKSGEYVPRHQLALRLYGHKALKRLSDRLAPLEALGGVLEKREHEIRIVAEMSTDCMRMRDDVKFGKAAEALDRYRTSPFDTRKHATGTGDYDAFLSNVFQDMADEGLKAFLDTVRARLAQLEISGSPAEVDALVQRLSEHCDEDTDGAEELLERIRALRQRRIGEPVTKAPSERPVTPLALVTSDESNDSFMLPPQRRRPSRRHAIAAIAVAAVGLVIAIGSSAFASKARVGALARVGVLDLTGRVSMLELWNGGGGDTGIVAEPASAIGTSTWRARVLEGSAINGIDLDPADSAIVVQVAGRRGTDLAYLHESATLEPLVREPEDDYGPVFSSDGRWMAYASARGSTSIYDVDVWIRDRWNAIEGPVALGSGRNEGALRFDPSSSVLWMASRDVVTSHMQLCRALPERRQVICRVIPFDISLVVRARNDTLIGIITPQKGDTAYIAEVWWGRDSVSTRTLRAIGRFPCTAHSILNLGACAMGDGVGILDARDDRAQWTVNRSASGSLARAFFMPADGEITRRVATDDLLPFGVPKPTITDVPPFGPEVRFGENRAWHSGVLLKTVYSSQHPALVAGTMTLPITGQRWQGTTIAILQIPHAQTPIRPDSSEIDDLTRRGAWAAAVCTLDIPVMREPEQRGVGELRGRTRTTPINVADIGGAEPLAFALEFDGRGACAAHVAGRTFTAATSATAELPLAVAISGRAVGTTSVVHGITVRGLQVPGSALRPR